MFFPAIVILMSLIILSFMNTRAVPGLARGLYFVIGVGCLCLVAADFNVGGWMTVALAHGAASFGLVFLCVAAVAFAGMGYRTRGWNVFLCASMLATIAVAAGGSFLIAGLPGLVGSLGGSAVIAGVLTPRK